MSMLLRCVSQLPTKNRLCLPRVPPSIVANRNLSSNDPQESPEVNFIDTDPLEEEEIDRIRNVSGLTIHQRRKMNHALEMPEMKDAFQNTVKYQRKLYATFGEKSGIDPRISWPTMDELKETIEEETEWEPTLQEMWTKLEQARKEKDEQIRNREELIKKSMAQMPKIIDQYYQRLEEKAEEARKQQQKKAKLLEEAREFFGYDVDPRDAKFQEMVEEKEKQRKKEAKAKKKLDQAAKLAETIRSMAEESRVASENQEGGVPESNEKNQSADSMGDNSTTTNNVNSSKAADKSPPEER